MKKIIGGISSPLGPGQPGSTLKPAKQMAKEWEPSEKTQKAWAKKRRQEAIGRVAKEGLGHEGKYNWEAAKAAREGFVWSFAKR